MEKPLAEPRIIIPISTPLRTPDELTAICDECGQEFEVGCEPAAGQTLVCETCFDAQLDRCK